MIIVLIYSIKAKVEEIRRQYSLTSIPVDLIKILIKEEIEVIERDFAEFEKSVNKQI